MMPQDIFYEFLDGWRNTSKEQHLRHLSSLNVQDLDPEKEPLLFRGPSSSRDFYSPEAYGWKGKRGNKVSPVPMHEVSTSI